MSNTLSSNSIEDKIIKINGLDVLIDTDVAELYGIETKRVNEAAKNNPDKFPLGYILELTPEQKKELVENFVHLTKIQFSSATTKAFTEKGLYMLATILKSQKATETTISIIETFTKMRNLTKTINAVSQAKDEKTKNVLMQKSGELIAEILDNNLDVNETETSIELNFAVLKFKHSIKKKEK